MVDATVSRSGVYASTEMPNLESSRSGITWSAIIGGAVAAATLSLILFALGAGLGFASVSPWSNAGASATAIGVGAGVWFLIVQWLSSAAGGYVAGRLRTKWAALNSDEVFFRDTAHGFLAWGLATLVTAGFLASVLSGAASLGGTVAAGAAQGATQAGVMNAGPAEAWLDSLYRPVNPAPAPAAGTQANQGNQDVRAESSRLLLSGVSGDLQPADRTYLAQLVAARTGLSQEDAEKRVDATIAQAKQAADTARKAAATVSLMTALSLMIGAFVAAAAGAMGGRHRDML
jgi:hypothetical protein